MDDYSNWADDPNAKDLTFSSTVKKNGGGRIGQIPNVQGAVAAVNKAKTEHLR